jgi:formylglycine-generating enzyme required for sulfatase activity
VLTDADCDGVLTADDCDDGDTTSTTVEADGDCDGVLTADDCDDSDSGSTTVLTDADCDGVLTAGDCDDGDAGSGTVSTDADCDGVLTADDCDDTDAGSGTVSADADCDGVLTEDDCDDADATSVYDMDCDGVPTEDDCDDDSATLGSIVMDPDCDGVNGYLSSYGGKMVTIEAQTFNMGCTDGMSSCSSNEFPVHSVTLTSNFYVAETEVTQEQYLDVMGTNPSIFDSCGSDCPVENMTWHQAAYFANAVSTAEALTECYTCTGTALDAYCEEEVGPYDCGGYRLPTEAEWEAAARCGEDTLYAGSSVADNVAWFSTNSRSMTHPVASKSANGCGLYDMSGNVWEWTGDWYESDFYETSPDSDPAGASTGTVRSGRGGCWAYLPVQIRVPFRFGRFPTLHGSYLGFRLARTEL